MLKVTAEGLRDFQICGRLYDYRHGTKDEEEKKNIRERKIERFDHTIKRVATFFFYKKQNHLEPSYQALLSRWQKLWFADNTDAADIALMKNEIIWGSETSYTTQAAAALLAFYEAFSDKHDSEVVLIDEPFEVPLLGNVALRGTFDLITREKVNNQYQYKVYKWITTNLKRSTAYWSFDMAILDYAFRYRNNFHNMNIEYFIWDFGSTIPGQKQVLIEKVDHVDLKFWAAELEKEEVFVSRRGLTAYCKSCPFDKPCSKWQIPELKEEL